MKKYIGIIYYANGTKAEYFNTNMEGVCESQTAREFQIQLERAKKYNDTQRTPTRYEVKEVDY